MPNSWLHENTIFYFESQQQSTKLRSICIFPLEPFFFWLTPTWQFHRQAVLGEGHLPRWINGLLEIGQDFMEIDLPLVNRFHEHLAFNTKKVLRLWDLGLVSRTIPWHSQDLNDPSEGRKCHAECHHLSLTAFSGAKCQMQNCRCKVLPIQIAWNISKWSYRHLVNDLCLESLWRSHPHGLLGRRSS